MTKTRSFRTLAIIAATIMLTGFAVAGHAQVIKQFTAGTMISRVPVTPGISFTLPAPSSGSSWTHLTFSWFATTELDPVAYGPIFIFSNPYTGPAGHLDVNTPGVIAQGDSNGAVYVFDDQVTLAGNRTYYFYTTGTGFIFGGGSQAGTTFYDSSGRGAYTSFTNPIAAFRLSGEASSSTDVSGSGSSPGSGPGAGSPGIASPFAVPEPPGIIFLSIGALGLLGYGWRRGR